LFPVLDFEFRSRAAQALAPRVDIRLFFDICHLKFDGFVKSLESL